MKLVITPLQVNTSLSPKVLSPQRSDPRTAPDAQHIISAQGLSVKTTKDKDVVL